MTLEERAGLELVAIVPGAAGGFDVLYVRTTAVGTQVLAAEDAGHGHRAGRVSAVYWDPATCQPTRAGVALSELAGARAAVASDEDRGVADKLLDRPGEAIVRATGEVLDSVRDGVKAGADTVGDGLGRVAAVITEASARAGARGIIGFFDELPPVGKAIAAVVVLVVGVVAVRKLSESLEK